MLPDSALAILSDLFDAYQRKNMRHMSQSFAGKSSYEKRDIINDLELLDEYGYIEIEARCSGFYQYKLLTEGIDFANNGFQEPTFQPIVQGDNSIYISGSHNQIQNCYNNLSSDISNSDLPDDIKELMQSLLYELQNPHISESSKKQKIKTFLSTICGNALSSNASSGLTTLISSLFSQLPI